MSSILLLQLDGKLPNVALMRIAAHHKTLGDTIELRRVANRSTVERGFWDRPDVVYASAIFTRTEPLARRVLEVYPQAVVGGTGVDVARRLEDVGITTTEQDYSIYPSYGASIGFSQRGCRLRCPFCVVPAKEGAVSTERSISEIWRGGDHPREVVLLDNDFFGQVGWRDRIAELVDGEFRVSFAQGINARFLDNEAAAALASVDYRDVKMRARRIYTAWDNRKDEGRLFAGLERLVAAGVPAHRIMVYLLIGYWPGETHYDRDYRRARLREFGAVPYPMLFDRRPELLGFARWVHGGYDKRVPWNQWSGGRYQPRNLANRDQLGLPIIR